MSDLSIKEIEHLEGLVDAALEEMEPLEIEPSDMARALKEIVRRRGEGAKGETGTAPQPSPRGTWLVEKDGASTYLDLVPPEFIELTQACAPSERLHVRCQSIVAIHPGGAQSGSTVYIAGLDGAFEALESPAQIHALMYPTPPKTS
ncbi:hypothetical protein GC173_11430 [bacterium]|nr:hypothetical protein [bacterium]